MTAALSLHAVQVWTLAVVAIFGFAVRWVWAEVEDLKEAVRALTEALEPFELPADSSAREPFKAVPVKKAKP